jgi:pyruvate/2-oxoglutarate dehydrogenase complex dihydrolipoamide dehydrogenase (E3) component
MPSIVTASQLRTVLGVSVSLYSDSYLDEIINTAEAVILPMLVSYSSGVDYHERKNNVAKLWTVRPHDFVVGSSVVVAIGHAGFNGTHTVTVVDSPYSFSYSNSGADVAKNAIIPNGTATLSGYSAAEIYATSAPIESAVLAVSVEVFQSRVAAGGQIEGVDFASTPYRMGRSLTNRVSTLLMPFLDVETVVQ